MAICNGMIEAFARVTRYAILLGQVPGMVSSISWKQPAHDLYASVPELPRSNSTVFESKTTHPGMKANGYDIPEGTVVSVAHYATHRDTEVFGEDADLFRPERWLEAGPSSLKRMEHSFMAVRTLPTEMPIADMRKSLVKAIEHARVVNSAS